MTVKGTFEALAYLWLAAEVANVLVLLLEFHSVFEIDNRVRSGHTTAGQRPQAAESTR